MELEQGSGEDPDTESDRYQHHGYPGGEDEREGDESPTPVPHCHRQVRGEHEHNAAGSEQGDSAGEERREQRTPEKDAFHVIASSW